MKPITVAIIAVATAAVGFFGGIQYQKMNGQFGNRQFNRNLQGAQGGMMRGRNGNFGGRILGEVIKVEGDTITVKLADESSKIITLTNTTTFSRSTEAKKNEIRIGEKISVVGRENEDKTVSAENIQINPIIPSINPTFRPQ